MLAAAVEIVVEIESNWQAVTGGVYGNCIMYLYIFGALGYFSRKAEEIMIRTRGISSDLAPMPSDVEGSNSSIQNLVKVRRKNESDKYPKNVLQTTSTSRSLS
jgi:hypothetical protein